MDLFHDFWFRFIPEKEAGLNPEPVVFGKEESEYEQTIFTRCIESRKDHDH